MLDYLARLFLFVLKPASKKSSMTGHSMMAHVRVNPLVCHCNKARVRKRGWLMGDS